jgi:hypothetical protein
MKMTNDELHMLTLSQERKIMRLTEINEALKSELDHLRTYADHSRTYAKELRIRNETSINGINAIIARMKPKSTIEVAITVLTILGVSLLTGVFIMLLTGKIP